jgi:hypothetical protein
MRDRYEKVVEWSKKVAAAVWRHRVSYAGLALAYGAGCFGVVEKDAVAQIVTVTYAMMSLQRH